VAAAARAELRLDAAVPAQELSDVLPAPSPITVLNYSPLAWAAALGAAAPFTTRLANFLPKERRASNARRQYLVTAILAGLLAVALLGVFVIYPALERRNYLAALNSEIRKLEPAAKQAQSLEQATNALRARINTLDDIRRRPQADLDILAELTKLLPPQVWTSSIEIFPDSVVIAGEADQAAPLLKLLDSSPLFQNSEFALSVTRNSQLEQFRIKTMRRNRTGRTTP
jgi:Tfp pilus assembly protein PilN